MELTSNMIKLKCIYEFGGEVAENTNFEAILNVKRKGYCTYDLEGFSIDRMDSQAENIVHKRYILGIEGLNTAVEILFFTVFPGNLYPISYRLKYDEEDMCYYGTWHLLTEEILFDSKKRTGTGYGFAKIELQDELHYSESDLVNEKSQRMRYFEQQYEEAIARRYEERTPTGELTEVDYNSFNKAKSFFNQTNKNQQRLVKNLI